MAQRENLFYAIQSERNGISKRKRTFFCPLASFILKSKSKTAVEQKVRDFKCKQKVSLAKAPYTQHTIFSIHYIQQNNIIKLVIK